MGRKRKRQLQNKSATAAVKAKQQQSIELSSDGSCDDIPIYYIKVPPKPPLKEFSDDIQRNSATSHDSFSNDRSGLHREQTAKTNLVVYTKRLDDMDVVSSQTRVDDPFKFFVKILAESKPKVTADSFKRRAAYDKKNTNPMSFLTLKYKIDRVNMSIQRKIAWITGRQNTELRKLDTELRRPLSGSEFINGFTKIITDLANANKPKSISYKEKDKKTVEDIVKITKLYMQGVSYRDNYFIFKNTKTNESEVYYVNEKGVVTKYYQTEGNMHDSITRTLETVEIPYCCWHQRNVFVNLMTPFFSVPTVKYLDKPHSCAEQCTCCCKNNIGIPNKPKKTEDAAIEILDKSLEEVKSPYIAEIKAESIVTPVAPKILIKNMLNNLPVSNLIKKAFAYTHQEKQELKTQGVKGFNNFKDIEILFNYEVGNDYYRLGHEGEIKDYLRNVSQNFIDEKVLSSGQIINEKICCWVMRDKVTNSLRIKNMPLDTWKYIMTRRKPMDKWKLCCKPIKPDKFNANLKEPMLPDIPNCTSEVCNKIPPLKFIFADQKPVVPYDLVQTRGNSSPDIQTSQIKMTTPPCPENPPIRNKEVIDVDEIDQNEAERRRIICSNTKLLLEKQLNILHNVSVNITPKGKITATLNIPVTKLTREELKVLSTILNEAQKDVNFQEKQVSRGKLLNNNLATNVAVGSKTHQRYHLYAAFSSWSHTHNDVYLKSLKSLLRIIDNKKLVKPHFKTKKAASASLEIPPRLSRKRRNNASQPSSKELPPKRSSYRKKEPVERAVQVQSHEIYIEPEIESLQLLEETEKPGSSNYVGIPSHCAIQNPFNPPELIPLASSKVSLDQSENLITDEACTTLVDGEEASITLVDVDDCILGA